jgi:hypothetical protein
VKCRRVETAVGRHRAAILAEFHHVLSHDALSRTSLAAQA